MSLYNVLIIGGDSHGLCTTASGLSHRLGLPAMGWPGPSFPLISHTHWLLTMFNFLQLRRDLSTGQQG